MASASSERQAQDVIYSFYFEILSLNFFINKINFFVEQQAHRHRMYLKGFSLYTVILSLYRTYLTMAANLV